MCDVYRYQLASIIMINCGGIIDVREEFKYPETIRVYVFDFHRPFHLNNVFVNNEHVILMGVDRDEESSFPPMALVAEEEDSESEDSADESDGNDSDAENKAPTDGSAAAADEDEDEARRAKKKRRLEKRTRKEARQARQQLREDVINKYYHGIT